MCQPLFQKINKGGSISQILLKFKIYEVCQRLMCDTMFQKKIRQTKILDNAIMANYLKKKD